MATTMKVVVLDSVSGEPMKKGVFAYSFASTPSQGDKIPVPAGVPCATKYLTVEGVVHQPDGTAEVHCDGGMTQCGGD